MLTKRIGLSEDFSISVGVAKNIDAVKRLERHFGVKAYISPKLLVIGALGAALFAKQLAIDG
jgi:activator of 2-hydroxyglutaryl-CoA dehydratase